MIELSYLKIAEEKQAREAKWPRMYKPHMHVLKFNILL